MIDFENGSYIKLKLVKKEKEINDVTELLINGEEIISAYKSMRDAVVFTNKRIIAVNVQGMTGSKKDYTSLPYSKISAFSVETPSTFDMDSELELYFSGLGKVTFEFTSGTDIISIGNIISTYTL